MIVTTTPTVEGNKLLRHGDYYKKGRKIRPFKS